jgi:hypothetical protein
VSPERIARVAEALRAKTAVGGVELRPDGSVVILTGNGPVALSGGKESRKNPLDRVLG